MTSKPEIIEALQFGFIFSKDPINTTGSARETITWQYAGTSEPADLPTSATYTGWTDFEAAEKAAFESALTHIETFLNVDFKEVTGSADPDLNVGNVTLSGSTAGFGGISASFSGTEILSADSYVVFDNTLDLSASKQFNLLLHELGHALGLKHPFSAPALPASENSSKFSVMSYTENPDNATDSDAMMLYDVFALQDIWGGAGYLTGNTSYTGSRTSTVDAVWDTGGKDIFDASARASAVMLDLREGAFSKFGTYEDVVIAYGTEIENASGGAGADTITGNGLANVLKGKGGNDKIVAGGKNDLLRGGNGDDVLKGQNGSDKLRGESGSDTLMGQNQNDNLRGGSGDDTLKGGKGKDTLDGQKGNDKLFGNQGADKFVFKKNGDKDTIQDFQNDMDSVKIAGLGTVTEVLAKASDVGSDVVFDFGNGDMLTVLNTTKVEITDDILT